MKNSTYFIKEHVFISDILRSNAWIILAILTITNSLYPQTNQETFMVPPPPCYANGNFGFGGAVGEGHFLSNDTNDIVWFHMSTSSNEMNDILVLYIDTGSAGRNVIGSSVDDNTGDHRIAISNSNTFGYGSTITFPPGFNASYAVAINTSFGGLWSIPSAGSVGASELNFITSVNSTLTSSTQGFYEFDFNWEDIGLTMSDTFDFVGVYVSNSGYSSDEGYGNGIESGTEGADAITFNGYLTFPGCSTTLSDTENSFSEVTVNYFEDQLFVNGINNKLATISVYDILGSEIYKEDLKVHESEPIQLRLTKNELQFIIIECFDKKKVIKVIPN